MQVRRMVGVELSAFSVLWQIASEQFKYKYHLIDHSKQEMSIVILSTSHPFHFGLRQASISFRPSLHLPFPLPKQIVRYLC